VSFFSSTFFKLSFYSQVIFFYGKEFSAYCLAMNAAVSGFQKAFEDYEQRMKRPGKNKN
jgi:hypothetical protein